MRSLILLALVLLAPAPAAAELWRWTDESGTVHFTAERDAIPPRYRDAASALEHPSARPAQEVPAAEPGAIAIAVRAGAPVVADALLNGVALRLLVDTGADRTVIAPEALARAGIALTGPTIRIVGVAGSAVATLVSVPRLDLGGARIGPLAVVAWTVPADGVDGLLGRDVLDAFTLTVDTASGRATLTPR